MKSGGSNAAGRSLESAGERQKVEVSFEQREGGECVALKYLTWTDGLGWCCQKTSRATACVGSAPKRARRRPLHR
jgi:hypothetical protein